MTTNTALWDSVETTPPSKTKAITGKPYKGTSPQPYYLIRKATEVFGPCGIGWGFTIIDERLENGSPNVRVHIARVRVWYEWSGKRGEVEHVGQTVFCGSNKNGPFTDEDAPKKSVTDALVKALSLIGFAGDIFSGRYDDSKYVGGLVEGENKRATPADDESLSVFVNTFSAETYACTTAGAIDNVWRKHVSTMNRLGIHKGDPTFTKLVAIATAHKIAIERKDAA